MNTRRTLRLLVLLAVAFGALLVAVFVWRPEAPDSDEPQPTLGEEYGIAFDDITKAVVEYADPTMPDITIVRESGGWRLAAPVDAPALESGAQDLLRVLDRNIRERIGPTREEYGFGAPTVSLTVEYAGQTKRFLFGNKGVSYSLYAKEEQDDEALLMQAWVLDEVMRTPAELRDRSVMSFRKRDVRAVSVGWGDRGEEIVATREDAVAPWRISSPADATADQDAIGLTLDALLETKAAVFVADSEADILGYDLGPAVTDVRVGLIEGGDRAIRVSREPNGPDGRIRVASIDASSVYEVSPDLLSALPSRALDWRNRRIADFQRSETHRVEVAYGDTRYALEKRSTLAEAAWHIVEPRDARADSSRIDELLFELDALEAEEILPATDAALGPYALTDPRLTVALYDSPGRAQATILSFGARAGGTTAVRVNESASVALVKDAAAAGWLVGAAGLRDRVLPAIDSIDVRRIEILRGRDLVAFTRQGVVWRISDPVVEQADNAVVDGILLALNGMTVGKFAPAASGDRGAPALGITLVRKNLERATYTFWTGGADGVRGQIDGDADAFVITPVQFAEVDRTLEDARVIPRPER
ncbi:DUF4340 domain-containing protein [Candidatus Poribacteria bacterium]|nr:DUF4340 domain-containing protein [Candidatus Poribacteria bacterium]